MVVPLCEGISPHPCRRPPPPSCQTKRRHSPGGTGNANPKRRRRPWREDRPNGPNCSGAALGNCLPAAAAAATASGRGERRWRWHGLRSERAAMRRGAHAALGGWQLGCLSRVLPALAAALQLVGVVARRGCAAARSVYSADSVISAILAPVTLWLRSCFLALPGVP